MTQKPEALNPALYADDILFMSELHPDYKGRRSPFVDGNTLERLVEHDLITMVPNEPIALTGAGLDYLDRVKAMLSPSPPCPE